MSHTTTRPPKRRLIHASFGLTASLCAAAFLLALPSWAQRNGSQGSSGSGGSRGGASPNVGQPSPMGPSTPQIQTPFYVNGRVLLLDTGQASPEPISVQLSCGVNVIQVIQTDLKGYFQFVLGAGPQSNANLSAADDTPVGMTGTSGIMGSPNSMGRFGGFGDLTGCELRVTVDGYLPATHILSGPPELSSMDVGTLRLTRIAGVQGSAISVTSLAVPNAARKEFEKGDKDARNKKFTSATEHLEKAVGEYDKYAAAWNELGAVYLATQQTERARDAFAKSIAADPNYIPPYVRLANLQLRSQDYEDAVQTSGKALALNPGLEIAAYFQAVANFKLNRLNTAEQIAEDASKDPHATPQWHALLAEILLQKQDYPNAAEHMRTYLKQAPKGPLAPEMKKSLDELEVSGGAGGPSKASSAAPETSR